MRVSGYGYTRNFTDAEWAEVLEARKRMRTRLQCNLQPCDCAGRNLECQNPAPPP
jgi:hypothetical protein